MICAPTFALVQPRQAPGLLATAMKSEGHWVVAADLLFKADA